MTVLGYAEVYMSILLLTDYLQHHTSQSNSLWALRQIGVCTKVFVSQVKTVTILLLLQIYIINVYITHACLMMLILNTQQVKHGTDMPFILKYTIMNRNDAFYCKICMVNLYQHNTLMKTAWISQ